MHNRIKASSVSVVDPHNENCTPMQEALGVSAIFAVFAVEKALIRQVARILKWELGLPNIPNRTSCLMFPRGRHPGPNYPQMKV